MMIGGKVAELIASMEVVINRELPDIGASKTFLIMFCLISGEDDATLLWYHGGPLDAVLR